jgi:hypothetical protein
MFRAAHRSSSGVLNCICSLWFIYTCDRPLSRLSLSLDNHRSCWQQPVTTWVYKPEAANTVQISWWCAVCRSKHAEPSINCGVINSITSCILLVFLLSHLFSHLGEIQYNRLAHNSASAFVSSAKISADKSALFIRVVREIIFQRETVKTLLELKNALAKNVLCPAPQCI